MCRFFVRSLRGRAVSFSVVSLVLAICAVASCPLPAWAAGGAEAKIRVALNQPTTLSFIETPLGEVVDYLKRLHKIGIQLDERAMRDAGVSADSPVTRDIEGTTLHSAMRLVLRDLDLTYVVNNEVLLITTLEEAERLADLRVYDVSSLLKEGKSADELAIVVYRALSARAARRSQVAAISGEKRRRRGGDARRAGQGPGNIVAFRHLLIARQTEQGHRELTHLLAQLEAGLNGRLVGKHARSASARADGPQPGSTGDVGRPTPQNRDDPFADKADPFDDQSPGRTKPPSKEGDPFAQ